MLRKFTIEFSESTIVKCYSIFFAFLTLYLLNKMMSLGKQDPSRRLYHLPSCSISKYNLYTMVFFSNV